MEITEEMRRIATESGLDPDLVECWSCLDGQTTPWYGVAPHRHIGTGIIGSTEILGKREWPANFEPDWEGIPESERESYEGALCGVWYCEKDCKHGGITTAKER